MAFLKPDKTRSEKIGGETITIQEKIIPDSARATKNVAPYVQKGEPMKPLKSLHGDGKPQGITVHNTEDISVPAGTTPAEQYTRATWPNQNMGGVCVHFYVYKSDIWQNLKETEQGWHATDGASRRASQRKGQTVGGNLDTIAIECIGKDAASEETTAKLCAYLCKKYDLDPATDIYQHNYFYPSKNCPAYIRPHWAQFLAAVKKYYSAGAAPAAESKTAKTVTQNSNTVHKKGDIVQYKGGYHYASSGADKASGAKRTAGKATVTVVSDKAKHPYHLVGIKGGSNVHGWVDAADISGAAAAPPPAAAPAAIKPGSRVKIKAAARQYARSTVKIPDWVKKETLTVASVGAEDVLLKQINSWVKKSDVEVV